MNIRKTKIVCTVGPAIESENMLVKMFNAGMNVARLNFSHGSQSEAVKRITRIRNASAKANKFIGIMLDTKGPEIRTGVFENGSCEYHTGDIVKLVREETICNHDTIYVNCKELFDDVSVDNILLIDDGKISIKITNVTDGVIEGVFLNDGVIKDHKGINAPSVHLSMPFISQQDYNDIKFGCEQDVDFLALSFVRNKQDILEVKELLAKFGKPKMEIISKIECQQAVDNLEEILEVSNGVMVARGDLGVEVAPELVPMYQKKIIKLANKYGKPVITATHMLESMILSPRPTRAEASDVANAILDGSDAIMLSGESAIGKYPVESVTYMDKIARNIESLIDYKELLEEAIVTSKRTRNDAISISAAETCLNLDDIKAVFAFTETGGTAKRLCKFRPKVPIIACTNDIKTCRRLSYYFGVESVIASYVDDMSMVDEISYAAAESIGLKKGDLIEVIAGFNVEHGVTNTLRIIEVK